MKKASLVIALALLTGLLFQNCLQAVNAETTLSMEDPTPKTAKLTWHSIDALDALAKKGDRPIIVDVYTDWCKWCKVMDEKTFGDEGFQAYVSENFYLVKFNAEDKSTYTFRDKEYPFVNTGRKGHHKLAAGLLEGRLSYPAFVILDKDLNTVDIIRGFNDPQSMRQKLEKQTL